MRAFFVAVLLVVLVVPAFAQSGPQTIIYTPGQGFQYLYQNRDGSGYIYNPSGDGPKFQYIMPSRRSYDRDDYSPYRDRRW